jgi:hypothetical protein
MPTKTSTRFTPFQLVYDLETVLSIKSEILLLKFSIELLPNTTTEEEHFLYMEKINKNCHDTSLSNEAHKKCIKVQYDKSIRPHTFS